MSGKEKTPGQAAFAAYYERQAGAALDMPASWDMQSDRTRSDWEAAAAAGAADVRARLDAACEQSAVARERLRNIAAGQPPELAAAMAETRTYREALEKIARTGAASRTETARILGRLAGRALGVPESELAAAEREDR